MISQFKKFTLYCILSFLVVSPVKPEAQQGKRANIYVHAAPVDSVYARESISVLQRAYEEISFDLQFDAPDTIHLHIFSSRREFRDYIDGKLPDWTGAFASPNQMSMFIKSPRWDRQDEDFSITLVHELFHLLIHQFMDSKDIPRWLNEGLAIFYSGEFRWRTATNLSKAAATNSLIPLEDIDWVLRFHRAKAELAYQQSYAAVRYLLATYDTDGLRMVIRGLRQNESLDTVFQRATGSDFAGFEQEWSAHIKDQHRWYWLSELDQYLWILIIVLFLAAIVLIRIRNYRKIKSWEQEPQDIEPFSDEAEPPQSF